MTAPKIPVTEYPIAARLTIHTIRHGTPPGAWFYWPAPQTPGPVQR